MEPRKLALGASLAANGTGNLDVFYLQPHHLVTHGCILGMTGSGKTGLCMVLVEETLRSRIPVLVIDVKGGLLFDELLAWVRTLPGTTDLRSLVVFDEVYGFLPPHPANPPAKRPLLTLMKQARGFGVGMLLATQNPMDVDYRALSNAGLWFVGRLQTDADRERVVEGLAGASAAGGSVEADTLDERLKKLAPRWFLVRDVHAQPNTALLNTRPTLTWMRGPMTRNELKRAREAFGGAETVTQAMPPATAQSEESG